MIEDKFSWNVMQFRFTGFTAATPITDQNLESFVEVLPNAQEKTKINDRRQNLLISTGTIENFQYELAIQMNKINLQFTLDPNNPIDDYLPSLGIISRTIPTGIKIISHWLTSIPEDPQFTRLAFGAQFFKKAEDRVDSLEFLQKFLPSMNINVKKALDFLFRINYREKSQTIDNLWVNRLSVWSNIEITPTKISIQPVLAPTLVNESSINYSQLEVDVNTDQFNYKPFTIEQSVSLVKELFIIGTNISQEGIDD